MKRVAIAAFSFGIRKDEPGLSNEFLAKKIDEFWKKKENWDVLVLAQWEIAELLKFQNPALVIKRHRNEKKYLYSEELALQAKNFLWSLSRDIEWKIIVVAHPFLHRWKCKKLFPEFKTSVLKTGWVPFDKKSIQWHTRGPIRLLLYAILQKIIGYKGKPIEELLKKMQ